MAQRVDKSHWDHDCGDQADVTAVIVMTQPADLPMLSPQGKSFQGRIYRHDRTMLIHKTSEYAEFTAAANALNRWLADEVSRRIEDSAKPKYPELAVAIARSISHNEIVSVEVATADGTLDDVLAAVWKIHGDKFSHNVENDGSYDIYGWSGDGDSDDAMDWRIRVTLTKED